MAWLLKDLREKVNSTMASLDPSYQPNHVATEVEKTDGDVESKEEESSEVSSGSALQQKGMALAGMLFEYAKESSAKASKRLEAVTKAVVDHTLIGDLNQEQASFEKQLKEDIDVSVGLPWSGLSDEALAKKQILSLSLDTRNFLRDSPGDCGFSGKEQQAMAAKLLDEDPNLSKVRFELVPKKLPETKFWCNYFYRVSLIVQSVKSQTKDSNLEPSATVDSVEQKDNIDCEQTTSSGEVAKESPAPTVEESKADDDWENELLGDLNEYEVVAEKTEKNEEDWEKQIQELLESE